MTIIVTWQLIVTLDSIHNSCDVLFLIILTNRRWTKLKNPNNLEKNPKNPQTSQTSQELRMLSSVTINCQVRMIDWIQVLNCQNCNQCLKCQVSRTVFPIVKNCLNVIKYCGKITLYWNRRDSFWYFNQLLIKMSILQEYVFDQKINHFSSKYQIWKFWFLVHKICSYWVRGSNPKLSLLFLYCFSCLKYF